MRINTCVLFLMRNLVYMVIAFVGIGLGAVYHRLVREQKIHLKGLHAFMRFLDGVTYQYTICQCVEEAVLDTMEEADEIIQNTLEEIYQLLLLEEKEELSEYKRDCANPFYYEFVVFSYLAMSYGDDFQKSIYLHNLAFLKQQIFIWILDREKLAYCLSGLIVLILVPMQFFRLIEIWAKYNLPELERYYQLGYGILCRYFILFCTVVCYGMILFLRENYEVNFHTNALIHKISNCFLYQKFYLWWVEHHPRSVQKLTTLLRRSSSRITLKELFVMRLSLAVVTSLISCIFLMQSFQLSYKYLIMCCIFLIIITSFSYQLPVCYLAVRIKLMKREKEDEVYFFYAITQMIAQIGEGDVDEVLMWLELGAFIMRPSIQICMDEYAFDNEAALEHVKQLEPFEPFIKLMDALKVSEQVGMEKAVYPLQMEQEYFVKKRQQDNAIWTDNKAVLGKFIAFIPMACTIGLYLIIPFVLESIVQLEEYIKQIQIGL